MPLRLVEAALRARILQLVERASQPRQVRIAPQPRIRERRQVGGPAATADGIAIIRVDSRTESAKAIFETQKAEQKNQLLGSLLQQRVEEYMTSLRASVKVEDHRNTVNAQLRKQAAIAP